MNALWIGLAVLVISFVLKAFFAVAELAVASADVRRLEEEGEDSPRARRVINFLQGRERILGMVLTGSTLAVVGVSTSAAILLRTWLPQVPEWAVCLVLGLGLTLFTELVPRGWAQPRAMEILPSLILPLRVVAVFLSPFRWLADAASGLFARFFQDADALRNFVTRQELRELLKEGAGEEIKPLERQMLSRVLDFSEIKVEEIMIPLIEVKAISGDSILREALPTFIREGFSRLPVYQERVDNLVGVLYAFDVLYADDLDTLVKTFMRPCKYVPETIPIDAVLADLQKSHLGVAIVVDEYGGAVGLVSVEDILEQIVGDIDDEFDRRAQELRRVGAHEYVVSARLKVQKLAQVLELSLPQGDYETVGGLLLAEMGRIPKLGETLFHGPLIFTVRKASDRAIKEVQVVVKHPPAGKAPRGG